MHIFRWRKKKQGDDDSDSDSEEAESDEQGSGSEDESSDEDRKKGVHDLIEIENPNRVQKKQATKLKDLDSGASGSSSKAAAPELSRREREELEKQQKQANYQKLHAQGKTDQARADLARLAIIRQQREEAAKMREQKRKEAEAKGK